MSLQGLYLVISGVYCGLAVVLGAFAAHGLKQRLPENLLSAFETGVHYQFLHGLAIIAVILLSKLFPHSLWYWSAALMAAGVLLFSGSLYMLALTQIKWFGPVTPLGGMLFIASWLLFIIAVLKSGASS